MKNITNVCILNQYDRPMIIVIPCMPNTCKPVHAVTSIKQSPVLKGHRRLVLPLEMSYELSTVL